MSFAALAIAAVCLPANAQKRFDVQHPPAINVGGGQQVTGVPEDWSSHHLHFLDPGTADDAIRNGTYNNWQKIVNEPRYAMQQMRRRDSVQGPLGTDAGWRLSQEALTPKNEALGFRPIIGRQPIGIPGLHKVVTDPAIKTDWSQSLGTAVGGGLAAGQFPAKYSFSFTTASCSDFVVFPTGHAGTGTQATIVGLTNIYTGCGGTVPTIAWAYNTGGTANTSPVLSQDGTQIAFVQTIGTTASLVLVQLATCTGCTVAAPATITSVTNAQYRTCNGAAAPCYTTLSLGTTDTRSAPFYVYSSADTMYVGDDAGILHQFTGVFQGTPAASGSPWPVTMDTGANLTSPVIDPVSGKIFVGDDAGKLSYTTPAGVASVVSGTLASGLGIVDAPVIDETPATPNLYVFVGDDAGAHSAVYQFATNFAATTTGIKESMGTGTGSTTLAAYSGDFDNVHYTGVGTTGNLYFCAGTGFATTHPSLYRIPMNTTFTGAVATTDTLNSTTAGACSPVTEFFNNGNSTAVTTSSAIANGTTTTVTVASNTNIAIGNYIEISPEIMLVTGKTGTTTLTVTRGQLGTTGAARAAGNVIIPAVDYVYVSVTAGGNTAAQALTCTTACLYSYPVGTSAGAFTTGTSPVNGVAEAGGASGVIIDNYDNSEAGAEQIYFSTLSATVASNAIQTSQSAP